MKSISQCPTQLKITTMWPRPFFCVISKNKVHFQSAVSTPSASWQGWARWALTITTRKKNRGNFWNFRAFQEELPWAVSGNKNFIHQSSFPPPGWPLQELCCLGLTIHFPASSSEALKAADTWVDTGIQHCPVICQPLSRLPSLWNTKWENINALIVLLLMGSCFLNLSTPINTLLSWSWVRVSRISPTGALRIKHSFLKICWQLICLVNRSAGEKKCWLAKVTHSGCSNYSSFFNLP